MDFEIIKIPQLSGAMCQIYSVKIEGEEQTLYEQFAEDNLEQFQDEVLEIYNTLQTIGNKTGAREQFFKINEGVPGDGVCALYDDKKRHLRLYCVRYGTVAVILGGGGYKAKDVRRWQDDPILTKYVELTKSISARITQAIKEGEITLSNFSGKFYTDR